MSLPATQTVPNYAILTIVYGTLLLSRRQRPQNGMGGYVAVAFLDVEANFLVVRSCLTFFHPPHNAKRSSGLEAWLKK